MDVNVNLAAAQKLRAKCLSLQERATGIDDKEEQALMNQFVQGTLQWLHNNRSTATAGARGHWVRRQASSKRSDRG